MSDPVVWHRDYETRSVVDLPKVGAAVYMAHPSTSIWCMAHAFGEEQPSVWVPGQPVPPRVLALAGEPHAEAWAHNEQFEAMVERYIAGPKHGFPVLRQDARRCTMAAAYAMALPGSLENAAAAVGLAVRKDMTGKRVMMQMARPRKIEWATGWSAIPNDAVRVSEMDADGWEAYATEDGRPIARVRWWNDPEKVARLHAYAVDDVRVEQALKKRLRPLSESEQKLWCLDQVINSRGVLVDEDLAKAAMKVVKQAQANLDAQMREKTGGDVSRCSNRNELVKWVRANGVECESVKKSALEELLADDNPLPVNVREVLLIRQEAAKASVAKIETLLRGKSPEDDRAKGLLQFHAASTGRWGGRRFQPQNLRRPEEEDVDTVIAVVGTGDYEFVSLFYDKALSAVADTLRGMLVAALGHSIMAADYSNIEGRVLAWLAGEEWKVRAFADFDASVVLGADGLPARSKKGEKQFSQPDLYIKSYAETFGVALFGKKDPRRQIGKVMELAGGFQGGIGAYLVFLDDEKLAVLVDLVREAVSDEEWGEVAQRYKGHSLTLEQWTALTIVISRWREKHPRIKQFWYDMEDAAVRAVQSRGSVTRVAGKIAFKVVGSFLLMRLPSGRYLSYPFPEVREFKTPWGEMKSGLTYFSTIDPSKKAKIVDDPANTSNWARIKTYGGSIVENATQAVARDVIAHAMPALEAAGYPIILTVHDEIVCEVPDGHGSVQELEEIMCTLPEWAAGLPVAAEGFQDRRYRK